MKGVVFVELISMAEDLAGEDAVDQVLEGCDLPSGGVFTTVGNYPCSELMTLVHAFSTSLDTPAGELQNRFGRWMFARFAQGYPAFFKDKNDAFSMLESIENEVHVEVRKLYPEAELPTFETRRMGDGALEMIYSSERPLMDFCQGMIEACTEHFGTPAAIERREHRKDDKYVAGFEIRLAA